MTENDEMIERSWERWSKMLGTFRGKQGDVFGSINLIQA